MLLINKEKVESSLIEEEANRLRPHYQSVFTEQKKEEQEKQLLEWARENVIERTLLLQAARNDTRLIAEDQVDSKFDEWKEANHSDGLSLKEEIELKKELDLQLRAQRIIEDYCQDLPKPTTDQARSYYMENRDKFLMAEQVRAAHIVKHINETTDDKKASDEIKKIQKEIKESKNFEFVADKYSDCPGNGGDLGYFTRGQMVQEFEDVVFSLKVNQISHIFKTSFGYHIAKVYDHKPSTLIGFKKVKDEILKTLADEMKNRKVEELLDDLKEKADIVEKTDVPT